MTTTNHPCEGELQEKADRLLDAAYEFWAARRKAGLGGAVVWLKDTDGKLVVFTRGEYLPQLMENIQKLDSETYLEFTTPEDT